MKTLFALALGTMSCAAWAQTPATNPMPDGSHDMYVGLGAIAAPRWQGAESSKVSALPVLQIQWSTGLFISGMSAGIHLSQNPTLEFGPLVAIQPRRDESGLATGVGGTGGFSGDVSTAGPPSVIVGTRNRLAGMNPIPTRPMGGGFFNYYLAPQWRLTSSILYGAGSERHGGLLDLGVQRLVSPLAQPHKFSFSAGVSVANRAYNQSYFGVTVPEAVVSGRRVYPAAGGLKDAHLGVRWNWALSPEWMLTSNLLATRLLGSASNSPLVERPTNVTVSTAIAYRF
ncbi:MipA/OmpV family protein [Massilia horti]|uniref:MipA/OmpV family protein n=1 Tax=Massilia horti TaxID=2562153 RepID=A0A4Y9SKV1_9BURK|nr:MipA/OmpV family protein [Massilia horti]TFW27315.1 MipA/OmpV family protein [Massilia horti]